MSASTLQESAAAYGRTLTGTATTAERRVVLHGVSWATYKALSKDLGDDRNCRLAFDLGELEIMSPQIPHEGSQFGIGQMVVILAEELGLPCRPLGSLTCEREDLSKAIEPDGCFYIQSLKQIKGVRKLDLSIHPPPDLIVEVDISTNSMRKLPICAALGVPEHWRFDGSKLEIRILKGGQYYESTESLAFPDILFANKIPEFVEMIHDDVTVMNRQFRAWVRAELRKTKPAHSRKPKSKK